MRTPHSILIPNTNLIILGTILIHRCVVLEEGICRTRVEGKEGRKGWIHLGPGSGPRDTAVGGRIIDDVLSEIMGSFLVSSSRVGR